RAVVDQDAVVAVAQGGGPGRVGADAVLLDRVAAGAGVGDPHSEIAVAGDRVGRPADGVTRGPRRDVDAFRVAEGDGAAGVRPDQVALAGVGGRAAAVEADAGAAVGGDDVACPEDRAADGVAPGPVPDGDAVVGVAQRRGAGRVEAEVIVGDG